MPVEIERRFLVCSDAWRAVAGRSCRYRQAWLVRTAESTVRVRRAEDHAMITVKGPRKGFARDEFEYRIPVRDAEHMLRRMCVTPVIEKVRHWVEHVGMTWYVDVYAGQARGLVLAEIELTCADEAFAVPPWVGAEVTDNLQYRSAGIMQGLWRDADHPNGGRRAPEPRLPERPAPCAQSARPSLA